MRTDACLGHITSTSFKSQLFVPFLFSLPRMHLPPNISRAFTSVQEALIANTNTSAPGDNHITNFRAQIPSRSKNQVHDADPSLTDLPQQNAKRKPISSPKIVQTHLVRPNTSIRQPARQASTSACSSAYEALGLAAKLPLLLCCGSWWMGTTAEGAQGRKTAAYGPGR